ncbi:hypothetical protein [Limnoglobus roseus]|uniref:Uncharacterized protein n=1 Tax=Limnoglobus roseus TaxID=2598579 RepID=A0A5C1ACW5_9BACT|nr:hypothetical protein [Limnoglobus roseus]QEL16053.1 hypothetical protein PX52LOC_02992 [Limnoglobus roseus]
MPSKSRRRWLVAVLVVMAGTAALYGYAWWASVARWVPGTYSSTDPDGQRHVVRYNPDGTLSSPSGGTAIRWRVAGRMLILEPVTAEPPGWIESVRDRFREPLFSNTVTRYRIVTADETGLVLSWGKELNTGVEYLQRHERQPDAP